MVELVHKRLRADPVIAHEHHSLFAAFMRNVYHLFGELRNFAPLESLKSLNSLRAYGTVLL